MSFIRYLFHRGFIFTYLSISIVIFLINALLSQNFWPLFIIPSVFSIAFLIRIVDDITDYKRDKATILSRNQLIFSAIIFAGLFAASNFLSPYYYLAPLGFFFILYVIVMQKFETLKVFLAPLLALFYIAFWWSSNDIISIRSITWIAAMFILALCVAKYKGSKNGLNHKNRR